MSYVAAQQLLMLVWALPFVLQPSAAVRMTAQAIEGEVPFIMDVDGVLSTRKSANVSFSVVRQGQETFHSEHRLTLGEGRISAEVDLGSVHERSTLEMKVLDEDGARKCSWRLFNQQSRLCGTGLFTRRGKSAACSVLPAAGVWAEVSGLASLAAADRGIGVEFEFVARRPGAKPGVAVLKSCAGKVVGGEQGRPCYGSSECGLRQYCNRTASQCLVRSHAGDCDSTDGDCPQRFDAWKWETDVSVKPLKLHEAKALGAEYEETVGSPFELVSPSPPEVLSGVAGHRRIVEVLGVLRHMGVQAGPSQGLHVHVNVASTRVPGAPLDVAGVASVWVAWAKYQLVIDEFMSSNRIGNIWAEGLHIGDCAIDTITIGRTGCALTRHIFQQMHRFLARKSNGGGHAHFCNFVLAVPEGSSNPCDERYPFQRYYQLNLAALARYGTVEFRGHAASYDTERVLRWVQFVVAFVEYFGLGRGAALGRHLFGGDLPRRKAWEYLAAEQRRATAEDLWRELEGSVDPGSAAFYSSRPWERGAPLCGLDDAIHAKPVEANCHWRWTSGAFESRFRCCCEEDGNCQWLPGSVLHGGTHCPGLKSQDTGKQRCAMSSTLCSLHPWCSQTHNRPGKCAGNPLEDPKAASDVELCS